MLNKITIELLACGIEKVIERNDYEEICEVFYGFANPNRSLFGCLHKAEQNCLSLAEQYEQGLISRTDYLITMAKCMHVIAERM